MTYIYVRWNHQHPDEPIHLFSELDESRFEVRKIEIFSDGRMQFADQGTQIGDTLLGTEPVPPLSEIAKDPQFTPREISAAEFEATWVAATQRNK